MRLWVSDASPIIALSWIGAAHLLVDVLGTVLVPEAVRLEAGTVPRRGDGGLSDRPGCGAGPVASTGCG